MGWIIVNSDDNSLVWSNSFGWVSEDGDFDTFTPEERETLNLPIGGEWRVASSHVGSARIVKPKICLFATQINHLSTENHDENLCGYRPRLWRGR